MKIKARFAGIALLALSSTALGSTALGATGASAQPLHTALSSKAVFVQTDNPAGNTVVAYHRAGDGTLSPAGVYPTTGLGGVLTGSVADHLASQGSLLEDDDLLYAVNAGSNSVTTFAVRGDGLSRRQVIDSGGEFPVSITAHGKFVYVLNARNGGSVQGYLRAGDHLLKIPGWNRSLGLDPTRTPEFTHTVGQIGFTPDGSQLVVTTKAGGQSILVFGVSRAGALSATPVVNADPGNVPFSFTFDRADHLVLTEAGPSAVATFQVKRDGTVQLIDRALTGGAATCWVVASRNRLFASNSGTNTVTGYDVDRGGALVSTGDTATDAGPVDAAVSSNGHFLYLQTGVAGLVDEFRVRPNGTLINIGSVTVPGGAGGEGIVAS